MSLPTEALEAHVREITLGVIAEVRAQFKNEYQEFAKGVLVETRIENDYRGALTTLRRLVYGRRNQVARVDKPSSVWQHFKEAVFPDWLLQRFPVQYDSTVIYADDYYPDFVPAELGTPYVKVYSQEIK